MLLATELVLLAIEFAVEPIIKRTPLLVPELFMPEKLPPIPAETFTILLLLLLVLLLLLLLEVGVLCAFGIMPFDCGDRADGSMDREPIEFGSPNICGSLITP